MVDEPKDLVRLLADCRTCEEPADFSRRRLACLIVLSLSWPDEYGDLIAEADLGFTTLEYVASSTEGFFPLILVSFDRFSLLRLAFDCLETDLACFSYTFGAYLIAQT